ncbi:MAG TPA: insulinase family protein, partial [Nitrospiria bacterium]
THQTIAAVLEQIRKIRGEPVSEEELRLAKDAYLNSFVFSFTSPSQIASRQAALEYYGLPPDYLDRFREGVVRVTRQDLLEAAGAHLRPEGMIIVTVGSPNRFELPLSDFGEVNTTEP